jgi:hypothetical protein
VPQTLALGLSGQEPIGSVGGSVGRESNMDLFSIPARDRGGGVATILWIIAAILVIGGIVTLIRGAVLYGIVLVIIGRLIGGGRRHLFLASDRRRRGREVLARSSSTCSQFVQDPCDERVRAVPYRLERPPQGGGDLLTALARDEMPKNESFILREWPGHDPLQLPNRL